MGRAKINIIVERSITYHLKKKCYRNIQRELKGHEHEISISTIHRVQHLIRKNLGASRKKAKYRAIQKATPKANICS